MSMAGTSTRFRSAPSFTACIAMNCLFDGGNTVLSNIPAIIISLSALMFTITSWWWLNARPGKLIATPPQQYGASMLRGSFVLRIPIVFFNVGALPVVVQNFRLSLSIEDASSFIWFGSCEAMFSKSYNKNSPRPFVVKGRDAKEVILEFLGKCEKLEPKTLVQVQLECLFGGQDKWRVLLAFNIPTPSDQPTGDLLHCYYFVEDKIILHWAMPGADIFPKTSSSENNDYLEN